MKIKITTNRGRGHGFSLGSILENAILIKIMCQEQQGGIPVHIIKSCIPAFLDVA